MNLISLYYFVELAKELHVTNERGIPTYHGQICLPKILPRFYQKWPHVHIQLVHETSEKMEAMLFNGN